MHCSCVLNFKGWEGDDRDGINRIEAEIFLFFWRLCLLRNLGFKWSYWCPAVLCKQLLVVPKYGSVSDVFKSLFLPVIYCHYKTRLLSVPLKSVEVRHSCLPFQVESGFRYHEDKKRGSEGASSNGLCFWNAESGIVMCFLCQGRQKMSEQVRVCCWAACQLSPFAVTRRPMWHYSGSLGVLSSSHSFGRTWSNMFSFLFCFFLPPCYHVSLCRVQMGVDA